MTTKKNSKGNRKERHVSVRSVRRSEPDVRRLGRALIHYALQQAADEAAAEAEASKSKQQEKPRD